MSLKEELRPVIGNRRKYLLLRIVGTDPDTSRKLCNVKQGTYNSWLQNSTFISLHRRIDEFNADYKHEAMQLLRRDNQLSAVMLEGKIIQKMKDEIESGQYELLKTNLAREVYSKLINDLDQQPIAKGSTFIQRVQQIFTDDKLQIEGQEVIDAEYTQADIGEKAKHKASFPITEGVQELPQAQEETEEGRV